MSGTLLTCSGRIVYVTDYNSVNEKQKCLKTKKKKKKVKVRLIE